MINDVITLVCIRNTFLWSRWVPYKWTSPYFIFKPLVSVKLLARLTTSFVSCTVVADAHCVCCSSEWAGWEETSEGQAVCLYCPYSSSSPDKLRAHMAELHDFDLADVKLRHNLSYYHQVKLINYIRRQVWWSKSTQNLVWVILIYLFLFATERNSL